MKKTAKPKKSLTAKKAAKLDLYAQLRDEYITPKAPAFVSVARAYYVGIAGQGAPGSPAFTEAVSALYNVAFTVKMARKFAGTDYTVTKLEGLWWAGATETEFHIDAPRDEWRWKLMIRIPDFVSKAEVAGAVKQLIAKGKPAAVSRVERFALTEGRCVQVLHLGPYADEPGTIARMRAFAEGHGKQIHGTHHEIYLSDPRRVAPAKLRTILRVPVA
jgi:hypothetical protein